MAETIEEFSQKIIIPIAVVGVVVMAIGEVLKWIWKTILSLGVPILWIMGVLFLCFWVLLFVSIRKRKFGNAFGALVPLLISGGVFSVVLAGGYHEKLPWAQRMVDAIGWIGEHPVLFGFGIIVLPIIAGLLSISRTNTSSDNADQCSSCETEDALTQDTFDDGSLND